jgi:hypothetical protein
MYIVWQPMDRQAYELVIATVDFALLLANIFLFFPLLSNG